MGGNYFRSLSLTICQNKVLVDLRVTEDSFPGVFGTWPDLFQVTLFRV